MSCLMDPSSFRVLLVKHAPRDVSIVQVHSSNRQSLNTDSSLQLHLSAVTCVYVLVKKGEEGMLRVVK